MKDILLESIGYVDAKYLDKAENYVPKKKNTWVKWGAIAACLCLIAGGLLPLGNRSAGEMSPGPGFAFAAYAIDADNKVISYEMTEGESVPVSFFETEKGVKGFFFSYPFVKIGQSSVPSRTVLYAGPFGDCTIDDLTGIITTKSMDRDQNYVFFVISADTEMPCSFPYVCTTANPDVIYQMDLLIDEDGAGHTATLVKKTEIKRVYEQPNSGQTSD